MQGPWRRCDVMVNMSQRSTNHLPSSLKRARPDFFPTILSCGFLTPDVKVEVSCAEDGSQRVNGTALSLAVPEESLSKSCPVIDHWRAPTGTETIDIIQKHHAHSAGACERLPLVPRIRIGRVQDGI